jgi:hypothetical protein
MALGHCLRDTAASPLTWEQYHRGAWTDWSLSAGADDGGVTIEREEHDPGSVAIALLVSATQPVEAAFANSRATLPDLRGVVHVSWPGAGTGTVMTPAQGVDFANQVRQALVRSRAEWRPRGGTVHAFIAAPAGLAVLIGQQLNTFGPVTVHEHVEHLNAYVPALTFAAPRLPAAGTGG